MKTFVIIIGILALVVIVLDLWFMRKAYKEHDVIGVIYWGLLSLCIISTMN